MTVRFTSLLAANADVHVAAIVDYFGDRLGLPTEFVDAASWQERERLLDVGVVHGGWICGYPYTRKVDRPDPSIELLAAPVMADERYADRPIYFSDVVVHRESALHSFADLRGATWAYNDTGSHSGYNVTRWHLAALGETSGYFGCVAAAGSHQMALQWVLDQKVDAAAIDSIVLKTELRRRPQIAKQIRIVETLGPSPIPPWVIGRRLDPRLKDTVRRTLLTMHKIKEGRTILAAGQMRRFVAVADGDYDRIREMARLAQQVTL